MDEQEPKTCEEEPSIEDKLPRFCSYYSDDVPVYFRKGEQGEYRLTTDRILPPGDLLGERPPNLKKATSLSVFSEKESRSDQVVPRFRY